MSKRTKKVAPQKRGHCKRLRRMVIPLLSVRKVLLKIKLKKVSASWEWANERAHRRRYDAVFDTEPSTNSIVSIIWWMKASPNV